VAFFLKKDPKTTISSSQSPNEKKKNFYALSTIGSCPKLLGEHIQKVLHKLTARIVDYNVWSKKKSFSPSCPAGTTKFDSLWGKIVELRKLGALHNLNAHPVRYLDIKS
jgi:hypothetical protein